MAYSFMSISKIKTMGGMISKYNHNYRKTEIDNAIPELSYLNEELIPLPQKADGTQYRYDEAYQERINSLPYYKEHKMRADQIKGMEVLLTFSKDEGIDIEQWKQRNIEWLHETFDKSGDGKSNVLSAVFHGDETGNVHIHAFVVPIDERGHLCAKRFIDGSRQLSDLQTSYADAMKEFGLERGLAGSTAQHKVIRKMYADLNNVVNLDDPKEGETAAEYKARIQEQAETLYAVRKKSADDYMVSTKRKADEYAIMQRDAAADEMDKIRALYDEDITSLRKEKKKLTEECKDAKEELSSYQKEVDALAQQIYDLKMEIKITEDEREKAVKASRIETGIEILKSEEPDLAERLSNDIEYAIARAEAREAAEMEILKSEPSESL